MGGLGRGFLIGIGYRLEVSAMNKPSSPADPQAKREQPFLVASGVSKSYGGVRALIESDFSCRKGEVHALLGENGAGKSTLVKILCGVVKPDTGTISLDGQEIHIESPADAAKLGIVAVFQELSLVPYLSVAENVYLGHEPRNRWGLIDLKKMNQIAGQLFADLGMDISVENLVSDLPLAQQQLVEIAKALSKDPEIIIFDEATSALGKHEVDLLFRLIKRLTKEEGKTAIFISHRMDELEQIADRATVFRDARYITTFDWGTVGNKEIINWIAGRKLEDAFPEKKSLQTKEIALEISGLSVGRVLQGINLQIRKGEILGIAGLQGHGQSEFLRALFGALKLDQGEIKVDGSPVSLKNPEAAIQAGIAVVPEDRKQDGLLLTRSVRENLSLMTLEKIQKWGLLSDSTEKKAVNRAVNLLNIKTPDLSQAVGNLSGGNQQKVVIGKAILTEGSILLLADPTRGIDVGTKSEIYQFMTSLAKEGVTILFYSTEIPELVRVCDRVAVFKQGRISVVLDGDSINEHQIIQAALGIA